MPASTAFEGVSKGLSPISSSMTSFPPAASPLAMASTVNAVSGWTALAKVLYDGVMPLASRGYSGAR